MKVGRVIGQILGYGIWIWFFLPFVAAILWVWYSTR